MHDDRGFFDSVVDDGRPLLVLVALTLIASGFFAIFQAATGHFLPHDSAYLGMTAQQLCSLHACRIVHFMVHDRISFGGVLVAIGIMYVWLVQFPLRAGQSWAWWALFASGIAGFLSFLAYLGYGYLDSWHGAATLVLLPLYAAGMWMTRRLRTIKVARPPVDRGRALLLASTAGIIGAGLTITIVGMTAVFVPQDLAFMGVTVDELRGVNERLVPLIAHDRAGFGGALISCGIAMFFAVLHAPLSRHLVQALGAAGFAGFVTAIGVHPAIGYTDAVHLAPAVAGCVVFFAGLALSVSPARSLPVSDPAPR